MNCRAFVAGLGAVLSAPLGARAQHTRLYRVGVIVLGRSHLSTIEGLREGLRELGLDEGRQYVLHIHDGKGDLKSVEAVARRLEEVHKVDAIVAVSTSVTLAAKRATKSVSIASSMPGPIPCPVVLLRASADPADDSRVSIGSPQT